MDGALVPSAKQETPEERLERWMTQYGSTLLRTCFVCLSDARLAQDATQDTFLKAWRAMDRFENRERGEKTWLLTIALNTCRDYRRSMWFRRVDLPGELEKLPPSAIAVAPKERELFLDVLALPEKYRQVILLYYYHNLTLRDMGEMLGLSASSIHHRLRKAEDMLRCQLQGRESIDAQ